VLRRASRNSEICICTAGMTLYGFSMAWGCGRTTHSLRPVRRRWRCSRPFPQIYTYY
jgi:hypothetical protein